MDFKTCVYVLRFVSNFINIENIMYIQIYNENLKAPEKYNINFFFGHLKIRAKNTQK